MPTFKICTLGCKVNQSESDTIAKQLQASDWIPADINESSQMVVINTCTVTQKAAMQSRQAVRQAIRANPDARIIVTGCYAQTEPNALEKISGIQYIVGNADKHRIVEFSGAALDQRADKTIIICNEITTSPVFKLAPAAIAVTRTRPIFKIQDGCNAACTYCIVPRARGPSRSLPPDDVIDGIRALSDAGYIEIVLSGIHLGHYGQDLKPETNLSDLLKRIEHASAIPRLRLSSIEPLEMTDELIEQMAESSRLCRHFHIPLQSGDNGILKKMRRPYTADDFKQLIQKIHKRIPDAAIGADILVGFPGENDAAFNTTFECIRSLPVTYLHVFPFSARPGTPAASYTDALSAQVIKERCEKMRRLGNSKRLKFLQGFIGQQLEILVESTRHAATGYLKGLSSNYVTVLIDDNRSLANQLLSVKIADRVDDALLGIIE
ncbi:MAG: tRNA (N(6)-L-threonylcarbamoyladenosine(37)-C(2))-methylthiotransferase MtaB [Desulfobacterales bacterium]|nr:tRNA (N(6)-L-threonylcarbamoyladenosine(37)-C(2))-methylthiotransferase MtaB [Deltaproteobacteria bacterium]